MEQYSYHEETGKITLEKKAVQNSENAGKSIYLMSLDEFLSHPRKLVRKNNFIHSMTPIQYCKIEKYRECCREQCVCQREIKDRCVSIILDFTCQSRNYILWRKAIS